MVRMMGPFFRWAAALLVQGLVLRDAVWFDGWVCPSLHLMGLLLLPLTLSPLFLLIIGGATGLLLDLMTAGGGLWTSSGLVFGVSLGLVNHLLAPREGYEIGSSPVVEDQGLGWFIIRALMLLVVHDLWRFGLEAGRWGIRWQTMPMAITSALASATIIVLIHLLFSGNRRKR